MSRRKPKISTPELDQLKKELRRSNYNAEYRRTLRSTFFALVIVAAVAVLIAVLCLPVLQVNSNTMAPTLAEGDIVVCLKTTDIAPGDIACFYIGNKLLIKRCVALPGQTVDMDESGNLTVDGAALQEPYILEAAPGDTNLTYPFRVPDNRIFCVGDNRPSSVDSRNTAVGCISEEQLVGKVFFRVWPLPVFGPVY